VHLARNRRIHPQRRATLAQRFDPRHNSLSVLRLALAVIVAVVHAEAIGWRRQPGIHHTDVGQLAVDGFFVVSGFLVTRSALRLPSLRRYAWNRALRILPGFWVCLLVVAFVAAPLIAVLQGRSPAVVLTAGDSSPGFVLNNATLLIRQWDVAGLMAGTEAGALDGALWTLWYEALCYAALAVLIRSTPQRRRGPVLAAGVAVAWLWTLARSVGPVGDLVGGPEFLPRFLLLFGLGGLGWIYADRLRFTPALLAAAGASLAVGLFTLDDYRIVGAVGLAYLLLWATVALPLRVDPPMDLSYGLYVYHWPVQQVLTAAGATAFGLQSFTLLALLAAGLIATASWRWVEAPALARKDAAHVFSGRTREILGVRHPPR
jgi:peptidoglycan/LPS O-acetylase OafA/YrhL